MRSLGWGGSGGPRDTRASADGIQGWTAHRTGPMRIPIRTRMRAWTWGWTCALALAATSLGACKGAGGGAVKPTARPAAWPESAQFQGYPVIHCSSDEVPRSFLADVARRGQGEEIARESYTTTRDLVLTTLNLFLATGRWAGERAQITATRDSPRPGAASECRMFELALADEITLRLPPSVSGARSRAPL